MKKTFPSSILLAFARRGAPTQLGLLPKRHERRGRPSWWPRRLFPPWPLPRVAAPAATTAPAAVAPEPTPAPGRLGGSRPLGHPEAEGPPARPIVKGALSSTAREAPAQRLRHRRSVRERGSVVIVMDLDRPCGLRRGPATASQDEAVEVVAGQAGMRARAGNEEERMNEAVGDRQLLGSGVLGPVHRGTAGHGEPEPLRAGAPRPRGATAHSGRRRSRSSRATPGPRCPRRRPRGCPRGGSARTGQRAGRHVLCRPCGPRSA